jgi:hypothetical protein
MTNYNINPEEVIANLLERIKQLTANEVMLSVAVADLQNQLAAAATSASEAAPGAGRVSLDD